MPQIEKHSPGSFCWMELATSDQSAAKDFYTALLGWEATDAPIGPGDYYTTFKVRGLKAAAGYTMRPDEAKLGIPPHWNLYITVTDAAASTKQAADLRGVVFCGPFSAGGHGLMSTIADPTGAVFQIWQSTGHPGIDIQGEHGCFCWADLSTPEPAQAAEFYTKLFGWSVPPSDDDYIHLRNGLDYIAGIPPASRRGPDQPPHWLLYFQVDDCDIATARARELGASIFAGPMTVEKVGRMTVLADPQGAVFSLFQPLPHE